MMENYYIVSDQQIFDKLRATADRYRNLALHLNERRWRNVKLRAETQAINDRLRELLKELEWFINEDGDKECPLCGGWEQYGHMDDCRLAKELDDTTLGS